MDVCVDAQLHTRTGFSNGVFVLVIREMAARVRLCVAQAFQKHEAQMAEAPVPDEATIPVRSVGVVTFYADRRGILLCGDGGPIRDVQTIPTRCYS